MTNPILCKWYIPVVGGLVSLFISASVFAAAPKQGTATGKSTQVSRVEQFLADMQKTQNAEQFAALLKSANLNDGELQKVAQELGKPAWASKLDTLKRSAKPVPHSATPTKHKGKKTQDILAELKATLERERSGASANAKQRLQTKIAAARAFAASHASSSRRMEAGTALGSAPRPPDAGTTPATIDSVSPSEVVVGQTVTINGSRFGSSTGRVVIRSERDTFPCEVLSWSNRTISVRIPQSVAPWTNMSNLPSDIHEESRGVSFGGTSAANRFLPATSRRVFIWVKLAGTEIGPWQQIIVGPDMALFTPTIDAVSPSELEPGSDVLIEGRNFGNQSDPRSSWIKLQLTFGDKAIPLEASEWRDNYIIARILPNVSGVQAMRGGILKVSNRLNLEAVKGGLTFTPAMDIQEITSPYFHAMCHPRAVPIFCFVGESNSFPYYNRDLLNGWTIRDSWVEINESHSQGPNYGCYFNPTPVVGSSNLHNPFVVWADGYSMVECRAHVAVQGPRGTNYR